MIWRMCRVGNINFSPHSTAFCLSSSPPPLFLPPPFISHLQFSPPSLKSLWISENIPHSAAMDELILTLCCCTEDGWACEVCTVYPHTLGIWQICEMLQLNTRNGSLNNINKKHNFPCEHGGLGGKTFCIQWQQRQRDFISVPANWVNMSGFICPNIGNIQAWILAKIWCKAIQTR